MSGRWKEIALATVLVGGIATSYRDARATTRAPDVDAAAPVVVPAAVTSAAARVDLGVIAVGDEPHPEFRIANDGPKPLTLHPSRVPRGVSVVALDATVAPGATGRVELGLDGFALAGPVTLDTVLTSDDPTRPEIHLTVAAEIRAFVLADPGFARWITVRGEREGTIGQTLWATDGRDFHVRHVSASPPALRVVVHTPQDGERVADASGSQWRVEATLDTTAPVGPLGGFIELALDHPRQRRLRIPVSGFVRPRFAVTPPAGDLGELRAGAAVRGRFVLKNFADESVAIEDISSDVAGLLPAAETIEAGHVYAIQLAVAPDAPAGAFSGQLRIRTSSAKERQVLVPVSGTIVDGGASTFRTEPVP